MPVTIHARPHGRFLASEAGELAGVSGTTIGQWARRGLIRSSIYDDEPRVYSVSFVQMPLQISIVSRTCGPCRSAFATPICTA